MKSFSNVKVHPEQVFSHPRGNAHPHDKSSIHNGKFQIQQNAKLITLLDEKYQIKINFFQDSKQIPT